MHRSADESEEGACEASIDAGAERTNSPKPEAQTREWSRSYAVFGLQDADQNFLSRVRHA